MTGWTEVGKRIKRVRTERNMSKAQFGKTIGVAGQHLGMVEKGIHGLSVDVIIKICHATGVTSDYLLFGLLDPVNDPATTAAVSGLSNEQMQVALDIVKKVAEFVNTDGGNEALIQEIASRGMQY